MKKQFLYFFLILSLASCLEEQGNPLVVASCTDKIKNQNETGIDCGGICGLCEEPEKPITVPCKNRLVNNRIELDGLNKNLSSADFSCYQESDHFEIFIYKDFREIIIEVYGTFVPGKTKAIPLVPYYDSEDGYASIRMTDFYLFHSLSGYLYVTKENDTTLFEFCDVDLSGQGGTHEVSGRIVCD
jgi:hypothetical protein